MNNTLELDRLAHPDMGGQRLRHDEQEFHAWVTQPENVRSLALPKSAARYLLIPPRLYELVEDPDELDISFLDNDREAYANKDSRIRQDMNSEKNIIKVSVHYPVRTKANPKNDNNKFPYLPNILEHGVNLSHKITHEISLVIGPHPLGQLHVLSYIDIEEFRGKGVASSFYKNLNESATTMGFSLITGRNNSANIGYYTGKLGRTLFSDLEPHLRHQLGTNSQRGGIFDGFGYNYIEKCTVGFVNDEAKRRFLNNEKS